MNPKFLVVAGFLLAWFAFAGAEEEYPVAKWADGQPGVVVSPFAAERLLDVADLKPGGLAEDPVAQKIFRIPSPLKIKENLGETKPGGNDFSVDLDHPNDPGIAPAGAGPLPADVAAFVRDFNVNSSLNDPQALLPFFANPVENYFGTRNMTREKILEDRVSYIRRFPQREYTVEGEPVLLSQKGHLYEVFSRVKYTVRGDSGIRSGIVSHQYKIRRASSYACEIVSIVESRARSAGAPEQKTMETEPRIAPPDFRPEAGGPAIGSSVYQEFQLKEIRLFLEAFASSGESNEPEAMLEFLAPGITRFYEMKNPDEEKLLQDRRNYIQRWPQRRYWVAQQPEIAPAPDGSWDILARTGWEVSDGTSQKSGVAQERLRVIHTPAGMKVLSIQPE